MPVVRAIPFRTQIFKIVRRLWSDQLRGYRFRRQLTQLAHTKPGLFFVQIGANDGVQGDPIRRFVLEYHWRGVLVEPLPGAFAQLQQNYRGQADLQFENAAIASQSGHTTLYFVENAERLVSFCGVLASFSREHILKFRWAVPNIELWIKEISVPCITWEELLKKYHITQIDLLCIDTEGFDYKVIQQVRFDQLRPAAILYEHAHLSGADRRACLQLLRSHGYTIRNIFGDTLAYESSRESPGSITSN